MELLEGLRPEHARAVLAASRRRRFDRREVLFHEGDPADALHLIDRGRVAVRVTTPLGETATLEVMGPGDVVGELALLPPPARRAATVVALEPTETLVLATGAFDELRRAHPEMTEALLAILARRARRQGTRLVEALYLPVEERLVRRLADLVSLYGGPAPVDIPLTQDDLAGLAGATRETVNRALQALAADGTVALARGRLQVLDPEGLARRVERTGRFDWQAGV